MAFSRILQYGLEQTEWIEVGLTDAADDIANQIMNTFASDGSDTESKDSEVWKSTGEVRAVSPDNILIWDGLEKGGLGDSGYSERLVYRPPLYEQIIVHRW